jgi:hypothetical protein
MADLAILEDWGQEALQMEPTEISREQPGPQSDHTAVWMRGLYMLILILAFGFSQSLLAMTAFVQFLWLLFAHEPNRLLARFGKSLSLWMAQTARFLTCASEEKPFPWSDWPQAD